MELRRASLMLALAALGTGACSALFDVSSLGAGGPDAPDATSGSDGAGGDGAAVDGGPGSDARSGDDGAVTGDGAAPRDAGTDAPSGLTEGGCPIGAGPAMVRANQVCIDATEVSEGQYFAFTQAPDAGAFAPSACGWNTSFTPSPRSGTYTWPPTANERDYPVQFVDWCDAVTYCAWAGKHLCGAVKPGDTINDPDSPLDASASQWYQACSHNGERDQPYPGPFIDVCGLSYEDGGGPGGVAPVGGHPGCEGGYDGLFDMVGNVTEWIDSCPQPGPGDDCTGMGGDVDTSFAGAGCTHLIYYARNLGYARLGFRCCAYPVP